MSEEKLETTRIKKLLKFQSFVFFSLYFILQIFLNETILLHRMQRLKQMFKNDYTSSSQEQCHTLP